MLKIVYIELLLYCNNFYKVVFDSDSNLAHSLIGWINVIKDLCLSGISHAIYNVHSILTLE